MTYEKRIEVRWRDVDALRHVNNAVFATYLEECRDGWLEQALGEDGALWDYVLARVAIDFRREIGLQEEAVLARATITDSASAATAPSSRRISSRRVRLDVPIRTSVARPSTASSSRPISRRKSIATRART